jgi:hypothetical protein
MALILLGYFALFIVPPVSSFASPNGVNNAASYPHEARWQKQTELFLFDIIIWQQFKKTKQSDFLAAITQEYFKSKPIDVEDSQVVYSAAETGYCCLQSGIILHGVFPLQSRSSAIRFSRSGISPPVIS